METKASTARLELESALEAARIRYTESHPASKLGHEEACKVMPGGNTRTVLHYSPFPLTIASGRSHSLTTIDGQTYVDFLNEYTAGIFGHNHPAIHNAIQTALQKGWNYGGHNQQESKLAAMICGRFPVIELVRFVNSGTEANMMAIATALVYTGRNKVIIFDQGYHGSTISGRMTSSKLSINLPHDFIVAKYNDTDGIKALIESLEHDCLAAILIEPMLGSGGCFMASTEFLICLRQLATKHEALLIFDEVMTSRLSYNGLGASTGIQPDLMTLGKYLGGGMSFGAFGGRKNIMDLYDPRLNKITHPGTFNNNVFSMYAGVAGAELLTRETLQHLNALGAEMQREIHEIIGRHGIYGKIPVVPLDNNMHSVEAVERPPKMFIKGVGSLLCMHFAGSDRDILLPLFYHHMLEEGFYISQRGFMSLSIELDAGHVAGYAEGVRKFCGKYQSYLTW